MNDHPGSLLQADPEKLASVLLTRAEPGSVGLSPVGGLLMPCFSDDEFAVEVRTRPVPHPEESGKSLRIPISPGLYANVGLEGVERLELGAEVRGPAGARPSTETGNRARGGRARCCASSAKAPG